MQAAPEQRQQQQQQINVGGFKALLQGNEQPVQGAAVSQQSLGTKAVLEQQPGQLSAVPAAVATAGKPAAEQKTVIRLRFAPVLL